MFNRQYLTDRETESFFAFSYSRVRAFIAAFVHLLRTVKYSLLLLIILLLLCHLLVLIVAVLLLPPSRAINFQVSSCYSDASLQQV